MPLLPKPVIALPRMKASMEGAAAVSAEPMAKSNLEMSRILLLSKDTSSLPLEEVSGAVPLMEGWTRLTRKDTSCPEPRSR